MGVTARISRNWVIRMTIIIVAALAFAGWCIYDARVRYPRINAEIDRMQEAGALNADGNLSALPSETEAEYGPEDRKTREDILAQYVMAAICTVFAVLILGRVAAAYPRTLYADDTEFVTLKGDHVAYGSIVEIDKKKWDRKGIAVVHYTSESGREKAVIDDWIYKGGEDVLATIEEKQVFSAKAPRNPEFLQSGGCIP